MRQLDEVLRNVRWSLASIDGISLTRLIWTLEQVENNWRIATQSRWCQVGLVRLEAVSRDRAVPMAGSVGGSLRVYSVCAI